MGNVLAIVAIILIFAAIFTLILRNRNKPERRLLRDFRHLRRLILKGMKGAQKKQAKALLEDCENYLLSLVNVREQQALLESMTGTASELTGRTVGAETNAAVEAFNARIAEDLGEFFSNLARVSTAANLHKERALVELAEFTNDLEAQRDALVDLTLELQRLKTDDERDLAARVDAAVEASRRARPKKTEPAPTEPAVEADAEEQVSVDTQR